MIDTQLIPLFSIIFLFFIYYFSIMFSIRSAINGKIIILPFRPINS